MPSALPLSAIILTASTTDNNRFLASFKSFLIVAFTLFIKISINDFTNFFRLLNLISNAVKFRKENKGKIIISITHNDEFVNIRVKDNGIGISKNNIDKIFGKYVR